MVRGCTAGGGAEKQWRDGRSAKELARLWIATEIAGNKEILLFLKNLLTNGEIRAII